MGWKEDKMRVYLVQHAQSKSRDEDPARGLTPQGITDTNRIAELLSQVQLSVSSIRHSGKKRAEQTASLLAERVKASAGVQEDEGLDPLDDPQTVADLLVETFEDLMLVGHLPHLERLASLLLIGQPDGNPVRFRNSGVVCLERVSDQPWSLIWAITPEFV